MAVVLPRLGNSRNSSTKDQIIYLLSQEWPLTAKQIYNRIVKEKNGISYQAVHKTLKEMLEERVLVKNSKGYCLDSDWISQLKDFGLQLEKAYSAGSKHSLRNLFENDAVNFNFETTKAENPITGDVDYIRNKIDGETGHFKAFSGGNNINTIIVVMDNGHTVPMIEVEYGIKKALAIYSNDFKDISKIVFRDPITGEVAVVIK